MVYVVGGWIPDVADQRDVFFAAPIAKALPPRVNFTDLMPPVDDQKALGSCTAQAAAACLQFTEKEQVQFKTKRPKPSRLFIYYNTRVLHNTVDSDSGASIRNTFKSLATTGYCAEAEWPYRIKDFAKKPPVKAYAAAAPHKLTNVQYQRCRNLADVKAAVAERNPVAFGFPVYESFEDVGDDGFWVEPDRGESMTGGHAVVAVGYDDALKVLICRNSWGKGWGMDGYFTMSYKFFSEQASDYWTLKAVPSVGGAA